MIHYDKLAEELIIRLEQGKNPNNYYVGNLSSVQEGFDCFYFLQVLHLKV